ncbi:hypothetical protein L596_002257 [Steinernema carpocapsae]|uniref:Uncharacterized protein n=1 Tax=Steinernema carpocapsae TaxID=34508 RepID=A0A4V6I7C7_STECR|nr:hypothetical protein L596_002257 [Steinernema carpocapsae]
MGLYRARSEAAIRASDLDARPITLVTKTRRSYDDSDLADYYRPQWTCNKARRSMMDEYWFNRYYYNPPARYSYYYGDYLPTVTHWRCPFDYAYDYYPSRRGRYGLAETYYRPYTLDPVANSFSRAMSMMRSGMIDYNTMDKYWLTPNYWDRRFKDYGQLHRWDTTTPKGNVYDRKAKAHLLGVERRFRS